MGKNSNLDPKPIEHYCCGAYCSEAGCCPYNFGPDREDMDPDTKDLFPNHYKPIVPKNPDLDND